MEKEGDRSNRLEVSRAAVARVVYLAQDRLDLGVAAVELAKTMAVKREGDKERLKRVARYLRGNPVTCSATQFRKKQTQLFCPRMPIGPHVAKHVVQTQEVL